MARLIREKTGCWLVERSGVGRWVAAGVALALALAVADLPVCAWSGGWLRACARRAAREEIFTAWVRRTPVVVTARDLPATTCGRCSLASGG